MLSVGEGGFREARKACTEAPVAYAYSGEGTYHHP